MSKNSFVENPIVGIIVPIYNTEKYVERCLQSILNNTYLNIKVFCIDDGSKDESPAIVEKIAKNDNRVILIRQENRGLPSARNRGIEATFQENCEVIGFVDSDDWVHPQYIEILLSGILDGYDISICQFVAADKYIYCKTITDYKKLEVTSNEIKSRNLNQVWDKLYRCETIKNVTFKNVAKMEDTLFIISVLAMNSVKICLIPHNLYFYFQRDNSLVRQFDHRYGVEGVNEIMNLLNDNNCIQDAKPLLISKGLSVCMACRYFSKFTNEYKDYKAKYNDLMKKIWKIAKEQKIRIKDKLVFKLFTAFPSLYRLFRIATDRTMLDWEKAQKAKNK